MLILTLLSSANYLNDNLRIFDDEKKNILRHDVNKEKKCQHL